MEQVTAMVGPYLLVRPLRSKHLRIYTVHNPEQPEATIASLWCVNAPELGVPAEWRIRCALCPEPPSSARAESVSKGFHDRDRALQWLRLHRNAKHGLREVAA